MRSDQARVRLGEYVDLATGFPFKSSGYSHAQDSVRLLRGDNVGQGVLRWEGARWWPQSSYEELQAYSLREGDVVLAMDRPWIAAGLKFAHIRLVDLPCLLVQRVARLRAKRGLDSRFLRYVIGSREFTEYILSVQTGTAVPHISAGQIAAFEVALPALREQQAVGELLGIIDDRIDLLRQTNATLESIAQALFKSWFIDFDPVRAKAEGRDPEGLDPATAALFPSEFEESPLGLIPKGWRCGCLGDVLTQRTSRAKASEFTATLPYVPIECITAKSIFLLESLPGEQAQSSLTLFKRGDILFGAMRPYFHKVCIAPFDGVTRTTAFVLRSEHPSFALFAMFDESTVEFATTHSEGSTIPYAKWAGSLERKPLVLPPTDLMSCFEAVATPIVDAGMQNTHRMRTLAELRDTLLPRLISGKLRLPEAEREIEDAIA